MNKFIGFLRQTACDRVMLVGDYSESEDYDDIDTSTIYDESHDYKDISNMVAKVLEKELNGKFTGEYKIFKINT